MKELFFLEISLTQCCFHIGKASELSEKNLRMAFNGHAPEYFPIFVGTHEECDQMADKLEHFREAINDKKRTIQVLDKTQNQKYDH